MGPNKKGNFKGGDDTAFNLKSAAAGNWDEMEKWMDNEDLRARFSQIAGDEWPEDNKARFISMLDDLIDEGADDKLGEI